MGVQSGYQMFRDNKVELLFQVTCPNNGKWVVFYRKCWLGVVKLEEGLLLSQVFRQVLDREWENAVYNFYAFVVFDKQILLLSAFHFMYVFGVHTINYLKNKFYTQFFEFGLLLLINKVTLPHHVRHALIRSKI